LKREHTVLEIGCGIGLLSGLFAKYLDRGKLLSLDISPKAVAMATARLAKQSNVSFLVSDMSTFRSELAFDRVVLPDVLEHIPEEHHQALFETIGKHLATDGKVLIHIPDPYALDRLRIESPQLLQIVDQSLAIRPMVERFHATGLVLERYEPYGLWTRDPDYDWIVFSRSRSQGPLAKRNRVDRLLRELRSRLSL
jgi:SAM-dependent methyltransferase